MTQRDFYSVNEIPVVFIYSLCTYPLQCIFSQANKIFIRLKCKRLKIFYIWGLMQQTITWLMFRFYSQQFLFLFRLQKKIAFYGNIENIISVINLNIFSIFLISKVNFIIEIYNIGMYSAQKITNKIK